MEGEGSERELEALTELEGLSLHEVLLRGHESLIRNLVARSMAGTLGHQEASILRNILRDNGLTMGAPPAKPGTKTIEHQPQRQLPVFQKPDYDE